MIALCWRRVISLAPRSLPLALLFVPGPARAGERLETSPVEVTSGPLLFLIQPDDRAWREATYVVDPESGRPPARFLTTPGNIQFLERIGRSRIVHSGRRRVINLSCEKAE